MSKIFRTYRELRRLETFEERFQYLKLVGSVGRDTFGDDRYLNQRFYKSREWLNIRQHVIARDLGCDLGIEGFDIHDRVIIHHMNPIVASDIIDFNEDIVNPEYLITTTHDTHNAIHYGYDTQPPKGVIERTPNDTTLW